MENQFTQGEFNCYVICLILTVCRYGDEDGLSDLFGALTTLVAFVKSKNDELR